MRHIALLILMIVVCAACAQRASDKLSASEFEKLMQTVAEGWTEGDARKAADCFTEQAIYTEPPDKQIYKGRDALFKFFGGGALARPRSSEESTMRTSCWLTDVAL